MVNRPLGTAGRSDPGRRFDRIPAIRDLIQEVIGFAPSEDVRKDLVVSSAAIQAAIDAGLPVLQVARCTSYDYGIVDPNGTTKVVIPRARSIRASTRLNIKSRFPHHPPAHYHRRKCRAHRRPSTCQSD